MHFVEPSRLFEHWSPSAVSLPSYPHNPSETSLPLGPCRLYVASDHICNRALISGVKAFLTFILQKDLCSNGYNLKFSPREFFLRLTLLKFGLS